MTVLIIVLTVIDAMIALLLIGVVLIQQSKDGGLGGSPFGGAGDSVFGGQAADHLTKITVILASGFLILTLILAVITGHLDDNARGVVENDDQASEMTAVPDETKKDVQKIDQKIIDTLGDVSEKQIDAAKKAETEQESKTLKVEKKAAVPKIPETSETLPEKPATPEKQK